MSENLIQVVDAGHTYELKNHESEGNQTLLFVKKEPVEEGSTEMVTVQEGTTNEAVLQMLINRMQVLDEMVPSNYNKDCLEYLERALRVLDERTQNRTERGVEGTHQA
jgi:hypothetical protein